MRFVSGTGAEDWGSGAEEAQNGRNRKRLSPNPIPIYPLTLMLFLMQKKSEQRKREHHIRSLQQVSPGPSLPLAYQY